MEKKEKFLIVLMTVIILVGVFIAFLISNSQKTPPEVLVQNEDRKIVSAILGGYTWKVFGTNVIADSVDLKKYDFSSENTIVANTGEILSMSTTEKFSLQSVEYFKIASTETLTTTAKNNETGSYFTINAPELEGTYVCLFKLSYSKGSAEYAVKVVVTDENIYEVSDIIGYKDTDILNISNIKAILKKLPYSDRLNGIIVNSVDAPINLKIKYEDDSIEKDDLLNNSIALFTLIPDLASITYRVNELGDEIYYTRDEVNNKLNRNVLEYADDAELWTKEVIYKESVSEYNDDVTIYTSVITTALSNLKESEVGEFVAIDILKNNTSGEISVNEFEKAEILNKLSAEYDVVLNVNKDEFDSKGGTLVVVNVNEKVNDAYIVDVVVETSNNKSLEYSYKVVKDEDAVSIQNNEGELEISGDVE